MLELPLGSLLALLLLPMLLGTVTTDWIEVFRAGDYPQGRFSADDVQAVADRYDPSFLEAPVSIDHAQEGPAYGWVEAIRAEGGRLFAKFKEMSEGFAKAINSGAFKRRSIELFKDLDGKGPYLKAVTWLGVKTPQVKGLEPAGQIAFSDAQLARESVAIHFDDASQSEGAEGESSADEGDEGNDEPESSEGPNDRSADSPSGDGSESSNDDGEADADEEDPSSGDEADGEAESEEGAASGDSEEDEDDEEEDDDPPTSSFAQMRQEVARLQTELQAERQAREAAQAEAETKAEERREAALQAFMHERVPPAVRSRVAALFEVLDGAGEVVSFSHDEDDDPVSCFKALLEELSFAALFSEHATSAPDDSGDTDSLVDAVRDSMAEQGLI